MKRLISSLLVVIMLMTTTITVMPLVSNAAAYVLVWPVPGHTALSQPYHSGNAIDIQDSSINGAQVVAAIGGTVINAFYCNYKHTGDYGDCRGFGTGLTIHGDDGRTYSYAHMTAGSIPSNVYKGARVSAGQVIGRVGTTGNSTGPHLHFGISNTYNDWDPGPDPYSQNYIYTTNTIKININANGGSVLKDGPYVYFRDDVTISSNMVTREGYALKGWNAYRPSDGKWFVANVGWCTQSEITSNNYTKSLYPLDFYINLDGSWLTNCSAPPNSFTFYAVWEKAHIHNYNQIISNDPTCTAGGTVTYTCSCGDNYTETIPSLDHNWGDWISVDATCTVEGSNSRSCNRCGETENETIPANGEHTPGGAVETKAPTCTTEGTKTIYCLECRAVISEEPIPTVGHNWSEWIQISAPTATEDGEQLRYCKSCKTSEIEIIPALGVVDPEPEPDPKPEEPVDPNAPAVVSVNNYTVSLDKINNIKEIRYAIGHYTKGQEVREAEKNQTLSAALVNSYTVEGVMTYEVPWVGEYTFWVRYNDGSQYFVYADVNNIAPYLESDGLRLTVKDFGEDYKDMWIAEGTWSSYAEIKNNATTKYQAAEAKLSNYFANHDFTYTTANPGVHTVLIRYNDGTQDVLHVDLTVDVPTFDVNGLQVTVGNIPGVKIIRTAYGEYNSVAQIKNAKGVRNFNNKTAIKDAESYKIQYRDNGVVTVIVEYNTGYKHVEHIDIQAKQATMIQNKNTVMFDDLDGFVMIRYAKGTYNTSAQIKAATGSKVVKPTDLIGGYAIISELEKGTYTFCVQFDDESYNYFIVTVK